MYIFPRYHTNYIPIMEGWLKQGDEVCVLTRLKGTIEDYSVITPEEVPFSKFSELLTKVYVKLHPENDIAYDIRLIYGFPNIAALKKKIKEFNPDLVILREKSLYCIICNQICRRLKIKTVTYNQSPLFASKDELRRNFKHKIVDGLMPQKRYTPVVTKNHCRKDKEMDPNAFFAPFVGKLMCSPEKKKYFFEENINILEIGRYEKRKNHFLMIDAFEEILKKYKNIKLTIVGTLDGKFQEDYYTELLNYIKSKKIQEFVTLKYNLQWTQMHEEYMKADLYILPSTNEPAAVSIVEAMGYSIPVICSSGNGTSDYIDEGIDGYVFKDNDLKDLVKCIDRIVSDKNVLIDMGASSYKMCAEKYQFSNYYNALMLNVMGK